MSSEDERTVWVGNLHDDVTEEILYELFLQAGPLQYVRHPKDKASGRKKNFAFICYRHACSVPYSITLMNEMQIYGRSLRVQSRHLQDLRAKGLASHDHGGVHTIDPFTKENEPHQQQSSLMGDYPGATTNHPTPGGRNLPPHIVALAQQQIAMINENQSVPLSRNPSLNARMRPRDDRYGSINYGRSNSYSDHQQYSHGQHRHQESRSRGPPRHMDNHTMQSMKFRAEDAISQNTEMLTSLQERQGRFDKNRFGHASNNYMENSNRHNNRDGYQRSGNREHRQHPYDRYTHDHQTHNRHQQDYHSQDRYDSRNRDRQQWHGDQHRRDNRDRNSRMNYNSRY